MSNIIINIKKKLNKFFVIKKFCKHNKKNFKKKKTKNENEILIEFNAFQPTHIALSYLSNTIKKNKDSQIKAYFNYSLISSNLRPSLFKDWLYFLFTILVANSINYFLLLSFFSVELNYYDLSGNIFFTFLLYYIFGYLFDIYQRIAFKRRND